MTQGLTTIGAGVMKVPHAVAMHAIQVLPALAWLLGFAAVAEQRRLALVWAATAGYGALVRLERFVGTWNVVQPPRRRTPPTDSKGKPMTDPEPPEAPPTQTEIPANPADAVVGAALPVRPGMFLLELVPVPAAGCAWARSPS